MRSVKRLRARRLSFSALQRAENSSIYVYHVNRAHTDKLSVLFSEPKIPQSLSAALAPSAQTALSVLFSEPKIPQLRIHFSIRSRSRLSVLFSEPKIPQFSTLDRLTAASRLSVLFSEPKIPQWGACGDVSRRDVSFSALQRAENSSMRSLASRNS